FIGYAFLLVAVIVSLIPYKEAPAGALFLPWGPVSFGLGLVFLLAFIRNETEAKMRDIAVNVLGAGSILGLVGLLLSFFKYKDNFLVPNGLLLILLGLCFAWTFVGTKRETTDDLPWKFSLGIGAVGLVTFLVAFIWSLVSGMSFLLPQGLLLMAAGLLY